MGIDAIFNAHNWAVVPFHFWSLVLLCARLHRRQLPERLHLPDAAGLERRLAAVALPALQILDPVLPEHAAADVADAARQMQKLRRAHLAALLHRGTVDRRGVSRLLAAIRRSSHPLPTLALALVYAVFLAGLICATFIDFEHFIIPDEITLGGIVAGFAASFLLPTLHGAHTLGEGMVKSVLGAVVGAGVIYAVLRLGKLLFGRQKMTLPPDTKIVFTETAVCLPDREISYEEIFYRKSDTIVLQARTVELVDRCYQNVTVRLSPAALKIGDEQINPDDVGILEAVSGEIILPREAMGLGDVKFLGAIGAFIGWQGAVFSLMVSSMIGAAVGIVLILLRRREWSSRMPYGPYIAAAAVLWLFGGQKFFHALFAM